MLSVEFGPFSTSDFAFVIDNNKWVLGFSSGKIYWSSCTFQVYYGQWGWPDETPGGFIE